MSLFREIAKQVHPDLNGGSVNTTRMMQEVLANRNNEAALLNLARKWGLKLDGSFDDKAFSQRSSQERAQTVFEAVVGAIVAYSFLIKRRYVDVRGVIIGIRDITKGKMAGAKEYTIYNFRDRKIWKHKGMGTPSFHIVGMATNEDLQLGIESKKRIDDNNKTIKREEQEWAYNRFRYFGLVPNKNYEGRSIEALISFRGGPSWKAVKRTTKKCVYIYAYNENSERRISLKHVLDVRGV
jgi:hypothetical protein